MEQSWVGTLLLFLVAAAPPAPAQEAAARNDPEGIDFFETRIRPLLADRCYSCHSARAEKLKGNLKLDRRAGFLKGGDRGPSVVPGDPDRSLLIQAVRWSDEDLRMPPKEKLSPAQIADLEAWVRRGAPLPEEGGPAGGIDPAKARRHWAFLPPGEHPLPALKRPDLVRTPVDAFLLARLEARGMTFSGPADPRALLRRATYDLTGLPPSPEEIDSFLADSSPEAYEKAVERLLGSPQYGERWGRHWLDVARYADTKGYVYADREEARFVHSYVYRDWVVRSFNEDLPFDRFLMLQLAADQLADDRRDLAAMGFLTVGRRFINNIHDIIDDRIDTVGRGMMALTLACARCHDHKFDPVPTADYYSLYGVFHGSAEGTVRLAESRAAAPDGEAFEKELRKREEALRTLFEKKRAALLDRLRSQAPMYLAAVTQIEKLPTEEFYQLLDPNDVNPVVARQWHLAILRARGAFHPVFAAWHAFQAIPEKELAARAPAWLREHGARLNPLVARAFAERPPASMKEVAERYGALFVEVHRKSKGSALEDPAEEALRLILAGADSPIALPPGAISEVEWFFEEGARVELGKAQRAIDQWIIDSKGAPPHAAILTDRPLQANPRIFRRGNPANKGEEVLRRFLSLLGGRPFEKGSGRLELAREIASPENPLTARVWVNRVWLHHFGQGLVRTPSDFGLRSDPPTHPELLDWMARRFVADGWSTKNLHRLIVLSAAYRQSSEDVPAFRASDPENRLLWRHPRRRLDWESTRDSFLAVSGELDRAIGGKPVPLTKAPFPRRRTLYGFIDRLNVPGVFRSFDFAGVDAHSPQRFETTVPQQALFLMNSDFVAERARAVAARPEVAGAPDPAARVRALYRLLLGRAPAEGEVELGVRFQDQPIVEPVVHKPGPWRYGYGEYDPGSERVKSFTLLPHFTGSAWQGGPVLPDPALGWVTLTAQGGHAGNDLAHAAIRRWVCARDGVVTVSGTVAHKNKGGNGIRARLVSSRHGELGSWSLKQLEAEMKIKGLEVRKDDTLDFVVDFRGEITDDEFSWAPVISMSKDATAATNPNERAAEWNAAAEFSGPPPRPLSPLEKYVQALLLTNEFMFLD
jgi:mono/diheme cytochrome c family protein